MWTVDSLKEWHDFYVLVGTAGATLLALLFVAVSLGAGYLTEERQSGTRTFMSPVVVHFTSVFFLSAVALIPWHQARFFAALIGATALIGAIISINITIHGCLMLSTEAPVGEGIESSESGGVSVLTEGAGSVAA